MFNNENNERIYLVVGLSVIIISILFFVMKIGFDVEGSIGQFFVLISATLIILIMILNAAYVFYKLKINKN
jgi:uncharacterized membrane protein